MAINLRAIAFIALFFILLLFAAIGTPLLFYHYLNLNGFWTGFLIGVIEISVFLTEYILLVRRYYNRE